MARQRTTTAIRFDAEPHARLVEYSDATGLSINSLVNAAVREFIAGLPSADEVELRLTRKAVTDG